MSDAAQHRPGSRASPTRRPAAPAARRPEPPRRRPRCRPRRSSPRPPAASCSPRSPSGCSSTSSCPASRPASTPCSSSRPRSSRRPSSPAQAGLRRMDPVDAWLPVAALAFAAMPGIRTDDWLVTADLLLAGTLTAGTIACLAGGADHPRPRARDPDPGDGARRRGDHGRHPDPRRGPPRPAGRRRGPGATRARLTAGARRATPVVRGLLLARAGGCPVRAPVRVGRRRVRGAGPVDPQLAARPRPRRPSSTARCGWASWPGAWPGCWPSRPARCPRSSRADRPRATAPARRIAPAPPTDGPPPPPWWTGGSLGAANAAQMRQPLRLGSIEAATVLWLVVALFAAFVVLQLAYLFGGRDTLSVAGLTYSDYARRGFFELVAVAVLAGTLVVALDLAVARPRAGAAGRVARAARADGRRAALRVRPAPALPGRLRLDRAPVRRGRRDPVARGRARHRRVARARAG